METDATIVEAKLNPFYGWLNLQRALQQVAFDRDPTQMPEDEKPEFLLWNAFAASDELHEAMQEVGWKPWATSRHLNRAAFIGEIVDALHFIGNMLLTCCQTRPAVADPDGVVYDLKALADEIWAAYEAKVAKNIERQQKGYDGLKDKCRICRRELQVTHLGTGTEVKYCPNHGVHNDVPSSVG